ncbi:MAG TPA: hypothetical protein VFB65_11725 [Pyrinomonadaceae bacterium]|nr:hypothetical protein [Pyrinomonadaceae bacterium]
MKKLVSSILMLSLSMAVVSFPSVAQEPAPVPKPQTAALTNKDVVEMLKAGLTPEVVVAKIKSSETNFDTSPAALAELKATNVPDDVILAMVKGPANTAAPNPEALNADGTINVPDGTEIEIQLQTTASGEELKVGDVVDFVVVRPVQVNGWTIFEKNAGARARITTAKRAGHWGKAGKLEWAMQDIMATDGARVPARFTQRQIGDSKGGTVAVAAVATTVFLGPIGLLWGLKKGKPAVIPAGNRYNVFVHGDVKIKGKTAETTAAAKETP